MAEIPGQSTFNSIAAPSRTADYGELEERRYRNVGQLSNK